MDCTAIVFVLDNPREHGDIVLNEAEKDERRRFGNTAMTEKAFGFVAKYLARAQRAMTQPGRLRLADFKSDHGRVIVGWVSSAGELRVWAGADVPFPPAAALFPGWHADSDAHPCVLFDGEELVAYGETWVDREGKEIELARIIVAPARRGKGLGEAFTRLMMARAADIEIDDVFVRVMPENRAAIECYENVGFVRVSADEEQGYNLGQPAPGCDSRSASWGCDGIRRARLSKAQPWTPIMAAPRVRSRYTEDSCKSHHTPSQAGESEAFTRSFVHDRGLSP